MGQVKKLNVISQGRLVDSYDQVLRHPYGPFQYASSSSSSFQEMDGAVEAEGIEISLVQHSSRSRWFPSGPLRREGKLEGRHILSARIAAVQIFC